ncbi:MAG TPA: DmsC/YnfH family molybdoenzyme membrane anchor subunit [Kofleriaceae bacterium]|jgi:Fe-S-cluster-containing dehydrogenase component/DMSO reductase anchor subunit|nr:DmsC/YnfH family molybdoenzyme membrane anchor subunit [Kofleriaceae bacterium]
MATPVPRLRLPVLDDYLREQHQLTAVERFAHGAASRSADERRYRERLPARPPADGQQYAFEVDLDACTGCKACVTACHNLNGLEDGETWRAVGVLHGGSAAAPVKQTVSTACHHCLDPACLSGCPVGAYEKDPVTGIVAHLDDQCIGCQYCTFTCPYEVPQFSARLGIVRKCDMCRDRLVAGEAPACVQGCPNGAIAITVVDTRQVLEDVQGDAFLPGAPSPAITVPTTVYRTHRAPPRNLLPADYFRIAPAPRHVPLVVMLVGSQLSVGTFACGAIASPCLPAVRAALEPAWSLAALAVALVAMAASVCHLGRPRYAFRAVIGLATSWVSREILAFGGFAGLGVAYAAWSLWRPPDAAARDALGWAVAAVGLAGVACSVMVYHATRRAWWSAASVGAKFFATTALLGAAGMLVTVAIAGAELPPGARTALVALAIAAGAVKVASELAPLAHLRDRRYTELRRSAVLMTRDLRRWLIARFAALAVGLVVLVTAQHAAAIAAGALVLVAGELLERTVFFAAATAHRMPGGFR